MEYKLGKSLDKSTLNKRISMLIKKSTKIQDIKNFSFQKICEKERIGSQESKWGSYLFFEGKMVTLQNATVDNFLKNYS